MEKDVDMEAVASAKGLKGELSGFGKDTMPTKRQGELRCCESCGEFYVGRTERRFWDCPNCGSRESNAAFICKSCGAKVNSRELYRALTCHKCGNNEFKLHYSKILYGSGNFPKRFVAKDNAKCTSCGEETSLTMLHQEAEDVKCPDCGSKKFRKTAGYGEKYYHKHHKFDRHPIERVHRNEEKRHPADREELKDFVEEVIKLK